MGSQINYKKIREDFKTLGYKILEEDGYILEEFYKNRQSEIPFLDRHGFCKDRSYDAIRRQASRFIKSKNIKNNPIMNWDDLLLVCIHNGLEPEQKKYLNIFQKYWVCCIQCDVEFYMSSKIILKFIFQDRSPCPVCRLIEKGEVRIP